MKTIMELLVTLPNDLRATMFTPGLEDRLQKLGNVHWNRSNEQWSSEQLSQRINGIDVCVTGWGSPKLTTEVLDSAPDLKLVAHIGGSVAEIASDELYNREILISSGIDEMAPFVAEGILGMILASLRELPTLDAALKQGDWPQPDEPDPTLFGASIGFVGLGAVGEALLDLLRPFNVSVAVYDPYIEDERLSAFEYAEQAPLNETLDTQVVSIHAARTAETIGLLDADRLAHIPDGSLLVNAARGAIVDEAALVEELQSKRLFVALDVFESEPLPDDSNLRECRNTLLIPHRAGNPAQRRLAPVAIKEIERFVNNDPLEHSISRQRYELMTDESLSSTGD